MTEDTKQISFRVTQEEYNVFERIAGLLAEKGKIRNGGVGTLAKALLFVKIFELINPYYDNKLVADHSVQDISTAEIAKKDYGGNNDNLRKILRHDRKIVFVDTNDERIEDKHFVKSRRGIHY